MKVVPIVCLTFVVLQTSIAQFDSLYLRNRAYHQQRQLHQAYKTRHASIVMLGNSITRDANWSELLGRVDVVNRGIGGDNTYGFLSRMDDVVRLTPKFCFVMGGINDLFADIPVDTVISNYQKIVANLLQHGITPVVQSTLYVSPKWKRADIKNPEVTKLNLWLRNLTTREKIEYMELNRLFSEGEWLKDEYTIDGVHLTAAAYQVWAAEIERVLQRIEPRP